MAILDITVHGNSYYVFAVETQNYVAMATQNLLLCQIKLFLAMTKIIIYCHGNTKYVAMSTDFCRHAKLKHVFVAMAKKNIICYHGSSVKLGRQLFSMALFENCLTWQIVYNFTMSKCL